MKAPAPPKTLPNPAKKMAPNIVQTSASVHLGSGPGGGLTPDLPTCAISVPSQVAACSQRERESIFG
jgi:hypothetical protein